MDVPLIGATEADIAADGEARVDTTKVREQLERIRDDLAPLMSDHADRFPLKTVAVELGVTVGGEVGFIVEGAVEASATITLRFERP